MSAEDRAPSPEPQPPAEGDSGEEPDVQLDDLPPFQKPTGKQFAAAMRSCLEHEAVVADLHQGSLLADRRGALAELMRQASGWLCEVDSADTVAVDEVPAGTLSKGWGLQVEGLYEVGAEADTSAIGEVAKELQSLKETATNDERLRIFRNFIELLRMKALDQKQLAATGHLDATPLIAPAMPSLKLLRSFVNERPPALETAAVDAELAAVHGQIRASREAIRDQERLWWSGELLRRQAAADAESRQAVAHAAVEPNMTQLERHRWVTEQFTELFELHDRGLMLLRQKGAAVRRLVEANAAFKARAAAVLLAATAELDSKQRVVEDEITRCHEDMSTITKRCLAERVDDERLRTDFASWRALSDDRLKRNTELQHQCWAQLAATEEQLHKLGSERRQEVAYRCEKTEQEVIRRCRLAARLDCAEELRRNLQEQVRDGKLALALLGFTRHSVVNDVDKGISAQRKNAKHQLHELLLRTQRDELSAFRALYHSVGDLVQRKEIYASRLQAGMSQSWQLTMLYSEMHSQLKADVDNLRGRQRAASADFAPTEEALREARVEFAHPQNEAEGPEMKVARDQFAAEEQKGLEEVEAVRLDIALNRAPPPRSQRGLPATASSAVMVEPHPPPSRTGQPSAVEPRTGPVLSAPLRAPGVSAAAAEGVPPRYERVDRGVDGSEGQARGRRLVPAAPPVPSRQRRPVAVD